MIKNYETNVNSTIILKNEKNQNEVNLYSQEGLIMLSNLWIKVAAEFKKAAVLPADLKVAQQNLNETDFAKLVELMEKAKGK